MKILSYNHTKFLLPILLAIGIFLLVSNVQAEKNEGDNKKAEKIHVSADELLSDTNGKYAEFIGNVKATQGNTTITSERLKILYNNFPDSKSKKASSEESIEKIIAKGNVVILFDDKTAKTDEAEYNIKARTLVLTGPASKISFGNNFITAPEIIIDRNSGKMKFLKGVKSEVVTGDEGIK